ncbi:Sporulation related domain protein [compost metagenome]
MPERNDLDYQFDDEETEYDLDDEEAEGYDDDEEYEDEDGDEEYDDEYEDDEDGAPQGGGWKRTAIFAIVGLMVAGAGAYYFMSDGNLPFLAKKEPVPGASPFANPGGFGKVAKGPEADPTQPAAVPPKPVAPPQDEVPQPVEPVAPKPVAPAKPVAVQPVEAPKPIAKPVAKVAPVKVPAAKPTVKPAESRPAKAAALTGRRYAVQVGSFADAGNANNMLSALKAKGYSEAYLDNGGTVTGAYAVRSTVVDSAAKANELKNQFSAAGHPGSVVSVGKGKYAIQLGIYSSQGSAQNLASELNDQGLFVSVASGETKRVGATRVRVGNFESLAAANQYAAKLRADGVPAIPVKR